MGQGGGLFPAGWGASLGPLSLSGGGGRRGLGTLYSQVGEAQQARAALGTAIELYRAMEMIFWLPQTQAVLAQTGERHKR